MSSIIPLIPIDLDKRRHLRFDFDSVSATEQALTRFWGREYTFFEAINRINDAALSADDGKISLVNLSILVWQGCRHEDAALTLAQVQAAMPHVGNLMGLVPLIDAILQAWQAGNPSRSVPTDAEVETEANPLDGSTGLPSGLSLVSTSD